MSLEGFIGLVAKRRVISILRTRRLNPFETSPAPAGDEQPEPATAVDQTLIERQQLHELDHMLRARLSELGLEMFYRLYVWEQELDLIAAETGLSKAAVYQWRSRLRTQLRQIVEERQERDQGPRPGAD
jgi:DNA-directed RNA polymerase specialized sigma24 family protein